MDLSTTYLGMKLKNPLVFAASPLSREIDTVKKMQDAGAAAVVMYSLFEEQINHDKQELDHFLNFGQNSFAEALSYFPEPEDFPNLDAEGYVEHLARIKKAVDIPVIASLNGVSKGGWMRYAKKMQEAGADAIELNIYYIAADPSLTSAQVEQMYLDDIVAVKESVSIPVALKCGPFFSSFANFARRADAAGIDGLVLFNRFLGPEIDLEALEVTPKLTLSHPFELRLPLRWIAILHGKIKADLAATSGIHTAEDILKVLMAGANVAMLTSSMLTRGVEYAGTLLKEMEAWLAAHEYTSIQQLRGSLSCRSIAEPAAYERANYMKALQSYFP